MSKSNQIGAEGEDFVEWVCQSPFGKDFLFRGPKYRSPDSHVELCDLLLLLGDTAVLFEVKTAQHEMKEGWTDAQWAQWANKRFEKVRYQLRRGCNALLSGLVVEVKNERQGRVTIDPTHIKHIYGVAVVDHPTLDIRSDGPTITAAGRSICVLATTHNDLLHVVTELSTVGDFLDYLRAREAFFRKNRMLGISELDLLAVYKRSPNAFIRDVAEVDTIIIREGCWEEYEKHEGRQRRAELDHPSFIVDYILDKLHEARHAKLPHIEERRARFGLPDEERFSYTDIAVELAQIRRMDRRVIGKKLIEKSQKCLDQKRDRWFGSTPGEEPGASFVFLVSTQDREHRMRSLEAATWGGKLAMKARRIIGIATEPVVTADYGFSVDAFMVNRDPAVDREMIPPDVQSELLAQFGTPHLYDETEFGDDEHDEGRDAQRA